MLAASLSLSQSFSHSHSLSHSMQMCLCVFLDDENARFSVSSIVLCYYDSPANAVYHTKQIIFSHFLP